MFACSFVVVACCSAVTQCLCVISHEGMDDGAFVLDDELAIVFGKHVFGLAAARLGRHLYWFRPQHILLQAAHTNALI